MASVMPFPVLSCSEQRDAKQPRRAPDTGRKAMYRSMPLINQGVSLFTRGKEINISKPLPHSE